MLKNGDVAPNFTLLDSDGNVVSLSDFKGNKVIIYFYPKDDTSGCTKEACSFRDDYDSLRSKNVVVIGISKDSVNSHIKFKNKYGLPFILLSDPNHQVIEAYCAYGEKKMYGKTYMGTIRMTYLVSEEGLILKIYDKVKPDKHVEEILKDLD